jgi:hypothetical protein
MVSMGLSRRHVLLIGLGPEGTESLAPLLQHEAFDVHTVAASPFVLDLVSGTPFEIVVAGYPMEGIEIGELIAALRDPASLCHEAGLMLVVASDDLDEAAPLLDHGVNRIVSLEWPRARIWQVVGDLLDIAPRVVVNAPIQVSPPPEIARDVVVLKTANISVSGALLTGFRTFPHGTRFDFSLSLPGQEHPIVGSAEVVRQTDQQREGVEGFGVRYLNLSEADLRRLDGFIAGRLRSPAPV